MIFSQYRINVKTGNQITEGSCPKMKYAEVNEV